MISRVHGKKYDPKKLTKTRSNKKMHMLGINKAHEIKSKSQAFGSQISHKAIHGKRILGSKNHI